MLFLYYYNISFRCFFSFLVRFSSGSLVPLLLAHFFSSPCSRLISISCKLFFFLRTSNSFFILMISLSSISFNLISSYLLCFSCWCLRLPLCWLACSCMSLSTLILSVTSSSLSYFLKSSASYTLSSSDTSFYWNCSYFSLFLGLILRYSVGLANLF